MLHASDGRRAPHRDRFFTDCFAHRARSATDAESEKRSTQRAFSFRPSTMHRLDGSTGIDLAHSSDGGATWSGAKVLFSNAGNPSAISFLVSAVGASGQGWAIYAIGKRDYDLRFSGK